MENYCNKIIKYFVKQNLINTEDSELYSYALNIFIGSVVNFATTALIGMLLHIPLQGLAYFITFFLLRKFTGGLHTKSFFFCYIVSSISTFLVLFIIKICSNAAQSANEKFVFTVVLISASVFIFFFSPFENENKPLSDKEKKIFKFIAFLISVAANCICTILLWKQKYLFMGIAAGILMTTILLLYAVVARKITENKKR